jgi:hypothetical protein
VHPVGGGLPRLARVRPLGQVLGCPQHQAACRQGPRGRTEPSAPLDPAVWEAKYARVEQAIEALGHRLVEAAPDAVVITGDDQGEIFDEEAVPTVGQYQYIACVLGAFEVQPGPGRERISR